MSIEQMDSSADAGNIGDYSEDELYDDAVPLIREQVDGAADEREKLKLLGQLATILDEKLEDLDGAFETCERILELRSNDKDALARMESIDERNGQFARLLTTLERRALLAPNAAAEG